MEKVGQSGCSLEGVDGRAHRVRVRKLTMTQTAVFNAGTAGMYCGPVKAIGKLMSRAQEFGYCDAIRLSEAKA